VSVDALFAAAQAARHALIAGKVLMDRHAPTACATMWPSERDSVALIGALARPRPAGLRGHGALCRHQHARAARHGRPPAARHPGLYMQTHVAENRAEVALGGRAVSRGAQLPRRLPTAPACSARARCWRTASGWTTPTAPAAPTPARRSPTAPAPTCSSAAACWTGRRWRTPAQRVTLASDVGGGTTLSMLRTMADAYKIQALRGVRLTAWKALYAATRGAARRCSLATRSAPSTSAAGRRGGVALGGRAGGQPPRRAGP
jgi:guanine deaminase